MEIIEVDKLVNLNGRDIYNFCRQLTQNQEEADELYQDTFLKAVEVCGRIHKEDNPKSYLMSIAIKLWKNRKRKFAWRSRIAMIESRDDHMDYDERPSDDIHSPEHELLKKEEQEMVRRAVSRLREEYRVPMYLYYAAGMSVKEIGRILHRPEGTVKSRLHKARKEVKRYLEVNGYER
ncbi:RNA polymerase sigma factor [Aminipila terrae]|uniref:Sigma-70 family RNA polymerase sigma factor n=1 Tax=Aminipila terrae TaxID=2697030 RepID=A0A6P1MJ83_9FIRM|nr:RNA polymerase sigma factor [Aminipila terrae]QHI71666.1 sigma-70 family RNA polymerase sigma factor [Aminipila terrae]